MVAIVGPGGCGRRHHHHPVSTDTSVRNPTRPHHHHGCALGSRQTRRGDSILCDSMRQSMFRIPAVSIRRHKGSAWARPWPHPVRPLRWPAGPRRAGGPDQCRPASPHYTRRQETTRHPTARADIIHDQNVQRIQLILALANLHIARALAPQMGPDAGFALDVLQIRPLHTVVSKSTIGRTCGPRIFARTLPIEGTSSSLKGANTFSVSMGGGGGSDCWLRT